MPKTLTCAIAGDRRHPPAHQVLKILPLGIKLDITPEPSNMFDPNALLIQVDMGNFPVDLIPALQDIIPEPYDACELCAGGLLQLGYVPRSGGKFTNGLAGNSEVLDMVAEHGGWDNLTFTLASDPRGFSVVFIYAEG